MFTAAFTRKTLQAICLSVWMCCLPALKAGIDCTECAESYSSAACCKVACTGCDSDASGILPSISVSGDTHGAAPSGEPCSCSCCVLRIDTVAAPNSSPRRRSLLPSVGHVSTSVFDIVRESAPPSRSVKRDRRCFVRSLECCIRLCRFTL